MRSALQNPAFDKALLQQVTAQAELAYQTMEQGHDCAPILGHLETLIGRTIHPFELHNAFSSISPETFSQQLLTKTQDILSDLTRAEMLEVLDRLTRADGSDFQQSFWLQCLEKSTGNSRISDLIYWPGDYFGDGDQKRELTNEEIIDTALRDARSSIICL